MKNRKIVYSLALSLAAFTGCDGGPDLDGELGPEFAVRESPQLDCVHDPLLPEDAPLPLSETGVSGIAVPAAAAAEKDSAILLSNDHVAENSPTGTVIGNLSHTLNTPFEPFVHYELVNANQRRFQIVGGELQTKCEPEPLVGCLDYELRPVEEVAVRVTIGPIEAETTLEIAVDDVVDGPEIEVQGTLEVDQYAIPFTPVVAFSLTEYDPYEFPDARISATVISGASNFAFTMNEDTLETYRSGELDALASPTLTLRVVASYQFLGVISVPFAVRNIILDVLPGTPPPPVDGTAELRFVVDSDLIQGASLEEVAARLTTYVHGVNEIYVRNTVRRFVFDPETSLRVFDGDDVESGAKSCVRSPHPVYTVYLVSGSPNNQTGGASCGRRGEDELISIVYHVNRLPLAGAKPNGSIGFETLVFLMAHELGHNHALIDNYGLINLLDATGVEPDNSMFSLNYDAKNAYWAARPLTWNDPMGGGGPVSTPHKALRFSPLDAFIIDRYALLEAGDARLNGLGGEFSRQEDFDLDVTVVDAVTDAPLAGCTVAAHFQRITERGSSTSPDLRDRLEAHTYETGVMDTGVTDASGVATVTLETSLISNHATIFKAQCPGRAPTGAALTALDFTAAREFPDTLGIDGGFNARLVLEAVPGWVGVSEEWVP